MRRRCFDLIAHQTAKAVGHDGLTVCSFCFHLWNHVIGPFCWRAAKGRHLYTVEASVPGSLKTVRPQLGWLAGLASR